MKRSIDGKRNLLFAAALVAAGLAVPAPAWAEPTGCSHDYPHFYLTGASGRYLMNAESSGNCTTYATRDFRVEIKHDIAFQPDPLVSHADDYSYDNYFYAHTQTCDNGNRAKYYGRSFFTSSATYHDSSHYTVDAC